MVKPADDETQAQLAEIGCNGVDPMPNHDTPLLICDVDEVVLHLVDPFVEVLKERGYDLKSHSFKLTGNVFHRETGREATQEEVWAGLDQLFSEQSVRQQVVTGAVDALNSLSGEIEIIYLTNMPHAYRDHRIGHLNSHGLQHKLITNSGSKVDAIRQLTASRSAKVGFVDDTPLNLSQVREHVDSVNLFHFMANDTFRNMVSPIDGVHISTGCWTEASNCIRDQLLVS